jgi:hypothetical protein
MVLFLMAAIHPSAWNRNSPKFAFIRSSEARYAKRRSRGSIQLHCAHLFEAHRRWLPRESWLPDKKITHLRYAAGLSSVLH